MRDERIISCSVIAKQHRPATVRRAVLVRAVHHVRMKKQAVARFHFRILQRHGSQHLFDAFGVCTDLLARDDAVIHPPSQMRAAQDLQTTVFFVGFVQCHHDARHVWQQTAVVVPVTVILVPFPSAAI